MLALIVLAGELASHPSEAFERPAACATCHVDIARQHEQAMMSQAYTHAWDEIEYFELAIPHAEEEPKVADVKAGCNGCHAPLAYQDIGEIRGIADAPWRWDHVLVERLFPGRESPPGSWLPYLQR